GAHVRLARPNVAQGGLAQLLLRPAQVRQGGHQCIDLRDVPRAQTVAIDQLLMGIARLDAEQGRRGSRLIAGVLPGGRRAHELHHRQDPSPGTSLARLTIRATLGPAHRRPRRSIMTSPAHSPADPGPTHRRPGPSFPRVLRVLLPALLIVGWLVAAGIGGPYFGRVDEVSSNDRAAYLPDSADATEVSQRTEDFTGSESIPAIIVVTAQQEMDEETIASLTEVTEALAELDTVSDDVSPAIPSEDGLAVQVFVPLDADADLSAAVEEIDAELAADLPEGLASYVTGPAGFSADLAEAFAGIDVLLLAVALAAVLVILLIVYRSLLLPLIVLCTSMFALCAALLTIWHLAAADVLLLSGQTQGILFILVIGAATDYSLLYVARYRDELR